MGILASIYAAIGADLGPLDRGMADAVKRAERGGRNVGLAFAAGVKANLSSGAAFGGGGMTTALGLEGASTLLDRLKAQFATIGRAGGIDYAAQIQRQEKAYTRLFGSAKLARDVIKEVQKNSAEAGVNSLDQLEALRRFNALPVAKERLPGILRTVTDTSAAYGFQGAERRRLVDNIGDIFGNGFDRAQSYQFQMLGINVEKTLGLGLGKTIRNEMEAIAEARKLSPVQQGEAFVKGLEKQFGGLGKGLADSTLLGRLGIAQELLTQAGEASGNLAIRGLMPLAGGLVSAAGAVKSLNEATGGGAGLVVMVGAGAGVLLNTAKVGYTAWTTLKLLNAELVNLAAAGGVSALTQGARAAASKAAINYTGLAGMPVAPAAAAAGTGFWARMAQRFPFLAKIGIGGGVASGAGRTGAPQGVASGRLGALGGKIASAGKVATPVGIALLAAQLGLGLWAGAMPDTDPRKLRVGAIAGDLGTGGLIGMIAGGILGSVIPGVGTVAGAAVGGVAGGAIGGIYGAVKPLDTTPQNKAAEKMERAADKLNMAAGSLRSVGGGSRVAMAAQAIEAQYALQGAF